MTDSTQDLKRPGIIGTQLLAIDLNGPHTGSIIANDRFREGGPGKGDIEINEVMTVYRSDNENTKESYVRVHGGALYTGTITVDAANALGNFVLTLADAANNGTHGLSVTKAGSQADTHKAIVDAFYTDNDWQGLLHMRFDDQNNRINVMGIRDIHRHISISSNAANVVVAEIAGATGRTHLAVDKIVNTSSVWSQNGIGGGGKGELTNNGTISGLTVNAIEIEGITHAESMDFLTTQGIDPIITNQPLSTVSAHPQILNTGSGLIAYYYLNYQQWSATAATSDEITLWTPTQPIVLLDAFVEITTDWTDGSSGSFDMEVGTTGDPNALLVSNPIDGTGTSWIGDDIAHKGALLATTSTVLIGTGDPRHSAGITAKVTSDVNLSTLSAGNLGIFIRYYVIELVTRNAPATGVFEDDS